MGEAFSLTSGSCPQTRLNLCFRIFQLNFAKTKIVRVKYGFSEKVMSWFERSETVVSKQTSQILFRTVVKVLSLTSKPLKYFTSVAASAAENRIKNSGFMIMR